MNIAHHLKGQRTTSTPLAGMQKNHQGGYTHVVDPFERAKRFLILGSEGGTFYVNEADLTIESAGVIRQCLQENGPRLVQLIASVSAAGLAPRVDATLLAFALVFAEGDHIAKADAEIVFPSIVRTGYHLLRFVEFLRTVKAKPGFGRLLRRTISRWFVSKSPSDLFYQLAKYPTRNGFGMGDVMRLVHPRPILRHVSASPVGELAGVQADAVQSAIMGFATKGIEALALAEKFALPDNARAYLRVMRLEHEVDLNDFAMAAEAAMALSEGVPREAMPPKWAERDAYWAAIAPGMPTHALLRNVSTLAARHVIPPVMGENIVALRLSALAADVGAARRARVHPFAVLVTLRMYALGQNRRGKWKPNRAVLESLEALLPVAAAVQEPTRKRILIACDTSGSMQQQRIVGNEAGITCAEAGALLAFIVGKSEPHAALLGFNTTASQWNFTASTSLAEIQALVGADGGTDCAQPILWALQNRVTFDAIIIVTDNETTGGNFHTSDVMEEYRKAINPRSKLIAAAMSGNQSTIADPRDPLAMNVCGMSADACAAISAFIASE